MLSSIFFFFQKINPFMT